MIHPEIVLAVALINFLAGFVGIVMILSNKKWDERNLHWGIGFGAGLLIGLSFLEIIPTAIDLATEEAMIFALLGFTGFFLIEKVTLIHHFDRAESGHEGPLHFSDTTFIALCLHALLDGVVIGLGLHFDEAFGLVIFVAILFHKMPLAVSVAGVFLSSRKKKKAVMQMLAFALATPVGLVAAVLLLGELPKNIIGNVIALSAGIFIYLGATDMLPEITHPGHGHSGKSQDNVHAGIGWIAWEPTVWVLIGMLVSFVPHLLLGDSPHHH